jgi:DNA-directed RNA polymerase specialized sigma24 family protein
MTAREPVLAWVPERFRRRRREHHRQLPPPFIHELNAAAKAEDTKSLRVDDLAEAKWARDKLTRSLRDDDTLKALRAFGYSQSEMAEILHATETAINSRLGRIDKKVKATA